MTTSEVEQQALTMAATEAATLDTVQGFDGDPDRPLGGGPLSHPEEAGLQLLPGFARMRTDWNSAEWRVIQDMHHAVNAIMQEQFSDLLDVIVRVYEQVRVPVVDQRTGLVQLDEDGMPVYERTPTGAYIEDWNNLGLREQENLIFTISAGLFRWEQVAEKLRAEALIGKAHFEEAFSIGYQELRDPKATIDDRTAQARRRAAEYRYRSAYLSYLSRRADAAVRSITLLGQRLKDVRTSG